VSETTRNPMECRVVLHIQYDEYTVDSEVKFTGAFGECKEWVEWNWRQLTEVLDEQHGFEKYWIGIENDYSKADYERDKAAGRLA